MRKSRNDATKVLQYTKKYDSISVLKRRYETAEKVCRTIRRNCSYSVYENAVNKNTRRQLWNKDSLPKSC